MTIEQWRGKEPHKSFCGRFTVRLSPDQHKKVIMAAAKGGKNLDSWIAEALLQAAQLRFIVSPRIKQWNDKSLERWIVGLMD